MAAVGMRLQGGHDQTVMTVAATNSTQVKLISGAECGEVAVWSTDGVNLHKFQVTSEDDDDVTSIVCSVLKPDLFYIAAGQTIHCYDIRQLNSPACSLSFNEDEINEISLNEKENFIAAAEDTGNVKIINLSDKKVFKTLRKHTNICSAVRFRPHRPWELLTGGYDSKLIQWDFSKSRAYCQIDMQEVGVMPENLDAYVVSPPFVHSVAVSSTGNTIAVGTENALVQVFDGSKRNLSYVSTLRHHTQGVSQVHIPSFGQDRFIVSGGNDGQVCIWDLQAEGTLPHGPALVNGCSSSASAAAEAASAAQPGSSPKCVIQHSDKINWLTCSTGNNNGRFIVLADNTSCPIVIPFPE